jgi:hypothetical protein
MSEGGQVRPQSLVKVLASGAVGRRGHSATAVGHIEPRLKVTVGVDGND